jgi:outer membrane protein OmpA-like peptidoglycan-associated protein
MEQTSLVPGLHIEAKGKGNDKGDLVAERVIFDPNSMRASRQIDARVSPLEARTNSVENRQGQLEGRTNTLESRAGQIEGRQNDLEATEKQTQQQVGQVKVEADQANQGVNDVNTRVGNLDNYETKYNATVYFRSGSAVLTDQAKKDLDDIAQKAKSEKGYVVEVAGFADTTGPATLNQELSQKRANAVIQYLEEQGDIPLNRVLTPAGLGTSHEVADNKTRDGRKLNRRVEVKVLVNQGLTASSGHPMNNGAAPTGTNGTTSTQPQ